MISWTLLWACLATGDLTSRPIEPSTSTPEPTPFEAFEPDAEWSIGGLNGPAWVVRTTADIPYVYATDRADLARVSGFVLARDRYFMIDLIRRNGAGRLSEVFGDAALPTDQENRGLGTRHVADQFLKVVERDPELTALFDGYVDGINAYVDAVHRGLLPVPSELALLGPLLGFEDPADLVIPFTREDMGAMGATIVYNLGFETGDVGRTASAAALDTAFAGAYEEALRTAGLRTDIWDNASPVWPVCSAPGWGAPARSARSALPTGGPRSVRVPGPVLDRLARRLERFETRRGHDHEHGFGSNAWAVAGSATADGRSLLAGDGHLPLSVPSLFYAIGMDTAVLGGGDTHQVGLVLPGLPTLAVGTNGRVAWSQTQLFGDITDWYAEELQLDADGRPAASMFEGTWRPLVAVDETYDIADVPILGSVGRTETWTRWTTFDGRILADVEGREAAPGDPLGEGEALINVAGAWVVPGDIDGDGVVSGVTVDHTAFDEGNILAASDAFGHAANVREFQEATRGLVGYSQNIIAADADGSILYTGYQAVPCRGYLPRNPDGSWVEGADPSQLLDGTRYPGFTIPVGADGKVLEGDPDPARCVVPFAEYPQVVDPPEGYVLTANNDIGCISLDGSLTDDPWYIGGPWLEGYRAKRIDDRLAESVGTATLATMSDIQGDHHSTVAEQFLPVFLASLDRVRTAAPGTSASLDRARSVYAARAEAMDEVTARLEAWQAADLPARSGVETFYSAVEPGDLEHSVATSIWQAWISMVIVRILDDERFPGVYHPTGDTGRTRTLTLMFDGRGPGNPLGIASWNPATEESIFFDIRDTPDVEGSDEVVVLALADALDALAAPPVDDGYGGYGTDDMDAWIWGLRHMVRFESLLTEVLGSDPTFSFLVEPFDIRPERLPLAENLPSGDPRRDLPWFPRHGDMLAVDAANPGFGTDDHTYGSGPVFRMAIALGPDGAEGVNVLPGGQSGLNDSPHFDDQAALWLGNSTLPMHTTLEAVLGDAQVVERFTGD